MKKTISFLALTLALAVVLGAMAAPSAVLVAPGAVLANAQDVVAPVVPAAPANAPWWGYLAGLVITGLSTLALKIWSTSHAARAAESVATAEKVKSEGKTLDFKRRLERVLLAMEAEALEEGRSIAAKAGKDFADHNFSQAEREEIMAHLKGAGGDILKVGMAAAWADAKDALKADDGAALGVVAKLAMKVLDKRGN